MLDFPFKPLFPLLVTIPAQLGDLLDQFLLPFRDMAGIAFAFGVRFVTKRMHDRFPGIGSAVGIVATQAIRSRYIDIVVFRLQLFGVVARPAKLWYFLRQQHAVV